MRGKVVSHSKTLTGESLARGKGSRLTLPFPSLFCQSPRRSSQWDPLVDVQLHVSVNPEEREREKGALCQ